MKYQGSYELNVKAICPFSKYVCLIILYNHKISSHLKRLYHYTTVFSLTISLIFGTYYNIVRRWWWELG